MTARPLTALFLLLLTTPHAPLLAQGTAAATAPFPEADDHSESIETIRDRAGAPGLVALALQDGEVVAWGTAGFRALGGEERMTIHDPIHLGSCSKAMTATLVATLVEEGKLRWETTIQEALPEFAKQIDAGYHDVTVEALLQHRGGIAERRRPEISALHATLEDLEGTPVDTRRAILNQVLASPPLLPGPNTHDYSNFGYMTAGMMIEELCGKPYEELIVERLFDPLNMTSAGVGSPAGKGVPVGHAPSDDGLDALPPGPGGVLHDAMTPAGLLHASLADWAKFVGEHVRGAQGEDGLVSAETIRRLQQDPGSGYAAGWAVARHHWSWGEGALITHNGSDGTWFSLVEALPEWDLIVLSASNAGGNAGQQATQEAVDHLMRSLGFLD